MTIIPTPTQPKKRQHRNEEAVLQAKCFRWLWNEYPETRGLYFATFNESSVRYLNKKEQEILGAQRNARGLVAGVADALFLLPKGQYHGAAVEFKTAVGRQRESQIWWQGVVESAGYYYCIVRSEDEFKEKMEWYLSLDTAKE